jgi:triacylglycerol lipase
MRYDPTRAALYTPEKQPPLDLARGNWSLDAICAELSRLAYIRFEEGHEAVLRDALEAAGYAGLVCFNGGASGAQAFACLSPDGRPIVSFRGTQAGKWADLRADGRFKLIPWQGSGEVHLGFKEALDSLLPAIRAWLGRHPGSTPLLTGHSLGAAMATLLASLIDDAELVTFGSPRCGNTVFADLFRTRTVRRYVDCCDGVTMVPPAIGYAHVCAPHYIDVTGKVWDRAPDDAAIGRDRRAARWFYLTRFAWRIGTVWIRELADHAPANYVSALRGTRGE